MMWRLLVSCTFTYTWNAYYFECEMFCSGKTSDAGHSRMLKFCPIFRGFSWKFVVRFQKKSALPCDHLGRFHCNRKNVWKYNITCIRALDWFSTHTYNVCNIIAPIFTTTVALYHLHQKCTVILIYQSYNLVYFQFYLNSLKHFGKSCRMRLKTNKIRNQFNYC